MMGAIALFGTLLAAGLFLIIAELLRLPRLATGKAMLLATNRGKQSLQGLDALIGSWAVTLAKFIPIDEYKKSRMKNTLKAAGIHQTPEAYTASALISAGLIALLVPLSLLVLPLLAPVLLLLASLVYFKEIRRADEVLAIKKGTIEAELPRFVATLTQELKASRDVLGILESYKKNAGKDLMRELDILTADMRSGSYEAALTRFEARINSPMLSDLTRGLIGVLRGDDGTVYFQMLAHDMKQLELQRLKAQALKLPPKIRALSLVMLLCFLITYLAVFVFEILRSLSGML